jgi:uncharacterized protein (DUF486 family)
VITILYVGVAVIDAAATIYFAWRSREFRKFLAGAFFVSGGIQFYLYLAGVSVPFLGTSFVQTPELSGLRSIVHLILFLICCYFGFITRQRVRPTPVMTDEISASFTTGSEASPQTAEKDLGSVERMVDVAMLLLSRTPANLRVRPLRGRLMLGPIT